MRAQTGFFMLAGCLILRGAPRGFTINKKWREAFEERNFVFGYDITMQPPYVHPSVQLNPVLHLHFGRKSYGQLAL